MRRSFAPCRKELAKILTTIALAAAVAGSVAIAADMNTAGSNAAHMRGMMGMMRSMQTMDANGDGMVSKEEFVKSHETMFDAMPKNKDGLVDMKDMPCA